MYGMPISIPLRINNPPKTIIITGTNFSTFILKAVVIKFPRRTTKNIKGSVPNPKSAMKAALCQIPPEAKLAVKAM